MTAASRPGALARAKTGICPTMPDDDEVTSTLRSIWAMFTYAMRSGDSSRNSAAVILFSAWRSSLASVFIGSAGAFRFPASASVGALFTFSAKREVPLGHPPTA